MEDILSSRFKRVEAALVSLVDSVSKCNPNPVYANDLVVADTELSKELEQLTIHQLNYARTLSLRKTSTALDNHIRDTLEKLASVRKEVISTPVKNPISNVISIPYTEILNYARRISKFTKPPSYQDPVISNDFIENTETKTSEELSNQAHEDGKSSNQQKIMNGQQYHSHGENKNNGTIETIEVPPTSRSTIIINHNRWHDYLNPRSDKPWTPWPSEEVIRRGALASIQILTSQNIDLTTFDPEKGVELHVDQRRVMDEDNQKIGEQTNQPEKSRQLPTEKQATVDASKSSNESLKPTVSQNKVFQLETFDDEEDEDFES